MRRSSQIAALTLATAVALPAGAQAQAPSPETVLAQAAPATDVPVPRDGQPLTATPLAARDTTLMADAGDAKQLLAQAPTATATPPVSSLPRTGPELLLTLLAGGGMLLAGAGLRLRLRAGEAPVTVAVEPAGPR
jgi:hypothetical protein